MKKNKRHENRRIPNFTGYLGNTESHEVCLYGNGEPTCLSRGWLSLELFLSQNMGHTDTHTHKNVNISLRHIYSL